MEISNNYINEIKKILKNARQKAYTAVNSAMVEAYWKIGRRNCRRRTEWKRKSRIRERNYQKFIKRIDRRIWKRFW